MDHVNRLDTVPLFASRDYGAPSLFTPQNLLREARRQKGLAEGRVPAICVFDPDGDLVDSLHATSRARRHPTWACYHTVLETFVQDEIEYGIIGRVVGAPFAVLVAEELFASGCQLLISITSAGQILPLGQPPYVILIDKACATRGRAIIMYCPRPTAISTLHCGRWSAHTGTTALFPRMLERAGRPMRRFGRQRR